MVISIRTLLPILSLIAILTSVPHYLLASTAPVQSPGPMDQKSSSMKTAKVPLMPVVTFESQAQVIGYLKKNNSYSENIQDLDPTSRGNASNVVMAAGAGQMYVGWLSTFNGTTSVKLVSSFDGDNYNNATQVSAKDANASSLQMAASGKLLVLTWGQTNSTDKQPVVYVATSMNNTKSIKNYQFSGSDGAATQPKVIIFGNKFVITFLQQVKCNPTAHPTEDNCVVSHSAVVDPTHPKGHSGSW